MTTNSPITHTPGPWREGIDGNFRVYAPDNMAHRSGLLADVFGFESDERRANVRLIAAAPDLLAALRAVGSEDQFVDGHVEACWCSSQSWMGGHESACEQARAAVAKAVGL